ncbi:MAG: hypothetical protein ACI8WM_001829 [Burkholderiaceae bacterium]|jgi:hypothetical protein
MGLMKNVNAKPSPFVRLLRSLCVERWGGLVVLLGLMNLGVSAWAESPKRAAPDRTQTWCAPAEHIYFSCQIGRKTVSLCGSDRITKTEGYLQYRFGRLGKEAELIYPATQIHPRGQFRDYLDAWPKGYAYEIGFLNGGYNYSIYIHSSVLQDGDFKGVHIRKEDQLLPSKQLGCDIGPTTTYFQDQTALERMHDKAVLEHLPSSE